MVIGLTHFAEKGVVQKVDWGKMCQMNEQPSYGCSGLPDCRSIKDSGNMEELVTLL